MVGVLEQRLKVAGIMLGIVFTFACTRAGALPVYLETVKTAYTFKTGGVIESKGCYLCHSSATTRDSLNLYGKDVQSALKKGGGTVTAETFRGLNDIDSDGDGWSNGLEFKNDTLPGDPVSKPIGSPPSAVNANLLSTSAPALNPFSLQALLYPGHAQHPIIIHFPIALFVFSLILDLIGIRTGNRALNSAANFNLIAAAITGTMSIITGLLAWRFAFGGEPLTGDRWLLIHLVLGIVTSLLLWVMWVVRARTVADEKRPVSPLYLFLGAVTLLAITVTGHLGGVVSGVIK